MKNLSYSLKTMTAHMGGGAYTTRADRKRGFFLIARELEAAGYRFEHARNLKPKHVNAMLASWQAAELKPGTIKNRLSWMRRWAAECGKAGMIPASNAALGIENRPQFKGNKAKFLTPDGYARFRLAPGAAQQLLVLEFERGGAGHDPSPFFTFKLNGIRRAASLDAVEQAKGLDRAAPYLVVFPSATMRDRALDRWPDPYSPEWRRFFIKALPELDAPGADFSSGWWRPDRTRPGMYQGSA